MKNYITHSLKVICFITLTTLMLACGSPNIKKDPKYQTTSPKSIEYLLKQAQQAEPSLKNPLLVQAAGALLNDHRNNKALELLLHIDTRYLNELEKDSYHLFYGDALLPKEGSEELEQRAKASLAQLQFITKPNKHDIDWQIHYFQVLSDSYFVNHNYLEAAKQRIGLDDLITSPNELQENNDKIWGAINQMSPLFLEQMISSFNSKRVNGWLEIVYINQKWGNQPDQLLIKMNHWKQRHPLHPAIIIQPKSLHRLALIESYKPAKIAILLPLSGRFSTTGKMIHDGLIAAHYQNTNASTSPNIQFYDTSKSLSGLVSYQQAIDDGAEFIIGPLFKKQVDEIVKQEQIAVPTLFLNTSNLNTKRHKNIYQFVLSIEDKAIQAAHRAWEKGYKKGIAFVPDDSQGERAQHAFKQYFESLGGELIDNQSYKNIKNLATDVQNLLRVDDSNSRKKKMEKTLGRNIEFVIRRRQDIDFIFMLSKPKDGRRIKPYFDFYFAHDLPVVSTQRIYSGKQQPQKDNVLNGVEFSDIPLYISQQVDIVDARKTLNIIDTNILKGDNGRFFSLGYDAYQIISEIPKLRSFPDYRWYGLSGEIGINESGLVHRYLTWAEFKKGIPKVTKERLAPIKNDDGLNLSSL